jgi:hypothetical protein
LEVYKRPYDENFPLVYMDESPKQLIGETKTPIKAKPGSAEKHDYAYVRNGVCNVLCPMNLWQAHVTLQLSNERQRKIGQRS